MSTFISPKTFFISLAVITLVLVYFEKERLNPLFVTNETHTVSSNNLQQVNEFDNTKKIITNEVKQQAISPVVREFRSIMGDRRDSEIVTNWFLSHGYSFNDNAEYNSYNEDTLTQLSNNGDVKALRLLGDIYYRSKGYAAAAAMYLDAAARGSTDALERLGTIEEISHHQDATDEIERKHFLLLSLAWYRVAAIRGDRWPENVSTPAFMNREQTPVSALDNQLIDQMAKSLYEQIQNRRTQLGLGDFDNSTPEAVSQFFDQIEIDEK